MFRLYFFRFIRKDKSNNEINFVFAFRILKISITRQTYHTHINNAAFPEIIAQRKFLQDLYFTFIIDLNLNKDGLIRYLIKVMFFF